jgi:hypothetical protein
MNSTHQTEAAGLHASWRLDNHRITITAVHDPAATQPVLSFDPGPYPDLAQARETFPHLTALWDAVRHHYWTELLSPHRCSRHTSPDGRTWP